MNTLGDFIAKGVITIALVSDGNETLEDLGIECLTPGQTIIKCMDAKAVRQCGFFDDISHEELIERAKRQSVTIGELHDELAATKRELKLINGQLTTTLNNWEQAKGKLERQRMELANREKRLDERDAQTPDEMARARISKLVEQRDKAMAQCEEYREKLGRAVDNAQATIAIAGGSR